MIKDIVIARAGVNASVCDPVQWSDNEQLAINNGDQLTLLDPRLPNIHQSVISIDNSKILDSKNLFTINTILDSEVLETLDIGKFNKVAIDSDNNGFEFTRINEPIIVKHQWSPKISTNKDCVLGVLFNTGELFVFERTSCYADKYQVHTNFFDVTLAELGLQDAADLSVDYETFLRLKIKDFAFGRLPDICVSVVNAYNEIKIYSRQLDLMATIASSFNVVKHCAWWAGDCGYVCVTSTANEVAVYQLNSELEVTSEQVLMEKSRFKVSQVEWSGSVVLVATSTAVHAFDLASGAYLSHALAKQSWVTNLIITHADKLEVIISYEIGHFESVAFDFAGAQVAPTDKASSLNKFVSQRLVKFQLQNNATNMTDIEKVTRNFLNYTVEGNFLNFGAKLSPNGSVAIVYKIYPKNNLNYTIMSKNEYHIGFVPLGDELALPPGPGNPLAQINAMWFARYESLEVFPRNFSLTNSSEFVGSFVDSVERFRNTHTVSAVDHISVAPMDQPVLRQFLIENFTNNPQVQQYQNAYNLNAICLQSIQALYDKLVKLQFSDTATLSKMEAFTEKLGHEQKQIHFYIVEYLIKLVSRYEFPISQPIDMYTLMSYNQFLKGTLEIPLESSTIEFDLMGLEESFTVTPDDVYEPLVKSNSGHQWTRCTTTLLPLLAENKVDELRQFNYLVPESQNTLVAHILGALDYCVVTGNKTFAS